jgi:hypothetical protein
MPDAKEIAVIVVIALLAVAAASRVAPARKVVFPTQ